MVVDKNTETWELNMYKGCASLMQADTEGKNMKDSRYNSVPHGKQDSGVFSTMEVSTVES